MDKQKVLIVARKLMEVSGLSGLLRFFAKIKCLGFHRYETKLEYIGVYVQTFTWDVKGDLGKERYDVYLERCARCGKRRLRAIGGRDALKHKGIIKLKYRWEKHGKTS